MPDCERFLKDRVALHCGDCLDVLATLPDNSIDSCVSRESVKARGLPIDYGAAVCNDTRVSMKHRRSLRKSVAASRKAWRVRKQRLNIATTCGSVAQLLPHKG
jgi:hypothetical protein